MIYFSLGSFTKGDLMPLEMRDKIIEAFSKVPQRILWKYEKELENLPKNIKLTNWAPQQDILGNYNYIIISLFFLFFVKGKVSSANKLFLKE